MALVRAFGVVVDEVFIEICLHLCDVFIPFFASFDAEMLIEEGAMEAFEEAVTLRASDFGFTVFDVFELKEEFIRMPISSSAELSPVVGEDDFGFGLMFFVMGKNIIVEEMDSGERYFRGVKASPSVA